MASKKSNNEDGNSTDGGTRKSFGKVIGKFVDKTSMQGVVYIKDSKAITAKVIWTILLLGTLVVMSLHLYLLVSNFLSWPKKTTLSLGFSNLNLPAVTVCNVNVFQYSRLDQTSEPLRRLLQKVHPANFDQSVTSTTEQAEDDSTSVRKKRYIDYFDNLLNYTDDEYYDYDDDYYDFGLGGAQDAIYMIGEEFQEYFMDLDRYTRISIGHDMQSMLVRCNFNGIQCYAENFTVSQSPHYGNCFTLDSSKLIIRKPGPSSGLTLVLYLRTHEYLPGITTGYGARFHLHYPNSIPFPDSSGSFLEASRETHIALKQTVIQRIGPPHGVCEEGSKFKVLYGKEYNRQSCQYLCKSSTMVRECGCYDQEDDELFYSTPGQKVKACTKEKQYTCMFNVTQRALRKQLDCKCPDPCRETTYSLKMTTREWPTNDYSVLMRESICEDIPEDCARIRAMDKDDLRRNFLKVKVYYEDLNHAKIKELQDIEPSQFASDVGGAIGLWIGLSMLSMFEVIQLLYEILEYFFYYRLCKLSQSQTKSKTSTLDKTYDQEKHYTILYSGSANGKPSIISRETKWETSPEFPSYRFYKGSS